MRRFEYVDAAFAVIALVAGILFWILIPYQVDYQQEAFGITSRFFPTTTAILTIGASLYLIVQTFHSGLTKTTETAPGFTLAEVFRLAPFVLIIIAYVCLLPFIGFVATSIATLFILLYWSGSRNILLNTIISGTVPIVLYLFFHKVMEVPLPEGVFI